MIFVPLAKLTLLAFGRDYLAFEVWSDIATSITWIFLTFALAQEYARGKIHTWPFKTAWAYAFVIASVAMQTELVQAQKVWSVQLNFLFSPH